MRSRAFIHAHRTLGARPCLMAGPVSREQMTGDGLGFVQFIPMIIGAVKGLYDAKRAKDKAKAQAAQAAQIAQQEAAAQAAQQAALLKAQAAAQGPNLAALGSLSPSTIALLGAAVVGTLLLTRRN